MLTLDWVKGDKGAAWHALETVDLSNVTARGIYIIWHEGNPGRVVRIGFGDVARRLEAHRNDRTILAYGAKGALHVTWAAASDDARQGAVRHLADQWSPLVVDVFLDVPPIAVNSPW